MKNFSILSKHRKLAVFMATLWLLAAMLTGCGNLSGNKTAPPATPPTTKIRLLKINLLFKSGQRWLPSLTFR